LIILIIQDKSAEEIKDYSNAIDAAKKAVILLNVKISKALRN
jgi:hypothetical protein